MNRTFSILLASFALTFAQHTYAQQTVQPRQTWYEKLGHKLGIKTRQLDENGKPIKPGSRDFDGFDVALTACHRDGDNVFVDYLITNHTTQDTKLCLSTRFGKVAGASGAEYNYDFMDGNDYYSHGGWAWEAFTYPAGTSKRITMVVCDVPYTETQFQNISLVRGEKRVSRDFADVDIVEPKSNTNRDAVRSSMPDMRFYQTSCTRSGSTVEMKFNLTSENQSRVFKPKDIIVYDEEGNRYTDVKMTLGGKTFGLYNSVTLNANQVTNGVITITGVPGSVKKMSLIKVNYPQNPFNYYLQVSNLNIN